MQNVPKVLANQAWFPAHTFGTVRNFRRCEERSDEAVHGTKAGIVSLRSQ